MFCPFCGVENPDQTRYCKRCGKPLTATGKDHAAAPAVKKVATPQPTKPPKPQKVKKSYDGKLRVMSPIISIIVCALIIAGSTFGIIWENNRVYAATGANDADKSSTTNAAKPGKVEYDIAEIVKTAVDNKIKSDVKSDDEEVVKLENAIQTVDANITAAGTELAAEYTQITADNVDNYIYDLVRYAREWKDNGQIWDYSYSSTSLRLDLVDGGSYIYAPEISECDAGASGDFELKVATYQPCLSGYSGLDKYMAYPDQGAQAVDKEFDKYVFNNADNLDDGEVSPEAVIAFANYNLVLWHGHGAYDSEYGALLVSGIERNAENTAKYMDLILEHAIFPSGNTYLIGAEFFDICLEDGALDNSIIYLGVCSSGRDDTLANVLLEKGAEAVYANSSVIHTKYNLEMIKAVSEGLTKTNSTGGYNSVSEALEYAKDKEGERDTGDCSSTRVLLFTENEGFSLDWYESHVKTERSVMLVLDNSGSMYGNPLNETKKAAVSFVDTVLEQNAAIGVATFDDTAILRSDFTLSKTRLSSSIDAIRDAGSTNIYAGLKLAEEQFEESESKKKIIVLMSDGLPNCDLTGDDLIEYANELKDKGIYIYALGFFSSLSSSEKQQAQELMRGIASSGCYYDIDDADNIVYFFDDVATQISGQKYIYIRVACPVDVKVSYKGETLDSNEKNPKTRASFGSLTFEEVSEENEEESETDTEESKKDNRVKVLRLLDGVEYDIEIEGTDRGRMNYTIGYMDSEGEYSDMREFRRIPITRDTLITTKTGAAKKTVLEVDDDGDGKVDNIYVADKDSKGELLNRTLRTVFLYIIGAAFIALAVSILVLIFRVKKHKKWLEQNTPAAV